MGFWKWISDKIKGAYNKVKEFFFGKPEIPPPPPPCPIGNDSNNNGNKTNPKTDNIQSISHKINREEELKKIRSDIEKQFDEFLKKVIESIKSFRVIIERFNENMKWSDSSDKIDTSFDIDSFKTQCNKRIDKMRSDINSLFNREITLGACGHIIDMREGVKRTAEWNAFCNKVIQKAKNLAFNNLETFYKETLNELSEICSCNIKSQENMISKQQKDLTKIINDSNKLEDVISDVICTIANANILKELTNVSLDKCYFYNFNQKQ